MLDRQAPKGGRVAENTTRVGDLIKAKEIAREDVAAAISTVFDGKTTLPQPNGYELVLPDLANKTMFSRKALLSALIEGQARGCECLSLSRSHGRGDRGRSGLSK